MRRANVIPDGALNGQHAENALLTCVAGKLKIGVGQALVP